MSRVVYLDPVESPGLNLEIDPCITSTGPSTLEINVLWFVAIGCRVLYDIKTPYNVISSTARGLAIQQKKTNVSVFAY